MHRTAGRKDYPRTPTASHSTTKTARGGDAPSSEDSFSEEGESQPLTGLIRSIAKSVNFVKKMHEDQIPPAMLAQDARHHQLSLAAEALWRAGQTGQLGLAPVPESHTTAGGPQGPTRGLPTVGLALATQNTTGITGQSTEIPSAGQNSIGNTAQDEGNSPVLAQDSGNSAQLDSPSSQEQ